MSVEIPTELQPLVEAAIAKGRYENEQELITELLRLAIPAMDSNQKLRGDVRVSLEQIDRGEVREANFDAIRQRLRDEYDESGNQK